LIVRHVSRYFDRNPLIAVIVGLLTAFLIVYFAAPLLYERVEQPAVQHSKGAV
jgi:ABC-type microcin C transport system permease subunit YejB